MLIGFVDFPARLFGFVRIRRGLYYFWCETDAGIVSVT
jgi:hypothetical protein